MCILLSIFRSKSCFHDADGGTDHKLRIPLDECGMKVNGEGFHTQVLVIQHDDWLIFPGDTAFTVQCKEEDGVSTARIGLSDPDPSSTGKELPKHKKSTMESKTGSVVFTPDDIRPRKKKKKNTKTEL